MTMIFICLLITVDYSLTFTTISIALIPTRIISFLVGEMFCIYYVDRLEADCDALNAKLRPLNSFILPGGTSAGALLTWPGRSRGGRNGAPGRCERSPGGSNPLAATYLNRLSDLLFILARAANPDGDVMWVPGGERAVQKRQCTRDGEETEEEEEEGGEAPAGCQGSRTPRWNN